MKARKTVSVESIKTRLNHYLAYESPYITREMRLGAAGALEEVLFQAHAYRGFAYLSKWGYKVDESRRAYI